MVYNLLPQLSWTFLHKLRCVSFIQCLCATWHVLSVPGQKSEGTHVISAFTFLPSLCLSNPSIQLPFSRADDWGVRTVCVPNQGKNLRAVCGASASSPCLLFPASALPVVVPQADRGQEASAGLHAIKVFPLLLWPCPQTGRLWGGQNLIIHSTDLVCNKNGRYCPKKELPNTSEILAVVSEMELGRQHTLDIIISVPLTVGSSHETQLRNSQTTCHSHHRELPPSLNW